MTKKHFIALADLVKTARICPENGYEGKAYNPFNQDAITLLADWCETQNPNFNRERWLGYIAGTNGKNGGKV